MVVALKAFKVVNIIFVIGGAAINFGDIFFFGFDGIVIHNNFIDKRRVVEKERNYIAVGIYSVNTKQNSAAEIRSQVSKIVHEHKDILQMHGFFVDEAAKNMRFDIVVSFDSPDMKTMYNHVVSDVCEAFPDYDVQVQFDTDISD